MLGRIRLAGYPARTGYELPLLSHVLRHNTLYVRLGRLPMPACERWVGGPSNGEDESLPLWTAARHGGVRNLLGGLRRYSEFASAFQRTLQIGVELEVRLPAHPVARRTCGPNLSGGPMRSLRLERIGLNVPLGL